MKNEILNLQKLKGSHLTDYTNRAVGMDLENFRKALIDKKKENYIVVTQNEHKCINDCKHCFMVEDIHKKKHNPLKSTDVMNLFHKYHIKNYLTYMYFQEPMKYDDYFNILKKYPQPTAEINPIYFAKNKDLIKKIKDYGIKEIKHSIHGSPNTHSHFTNDEPGSFSTMLEGIRILINSGIRVGIETTFHNFNKDCVKYLSHLLDDLGVDDWYIGRVIPVGKAMNLENDYFLRQKDAFDVVLDITNEVSKINHFKPNIKYESVWGANFYNPWIYKYLLGSLPNEVTKSTYYCDAIDSHVFYTSVATSNVYPCFYYLSIEDEKIGNYSTKDNHIYFNNNAVNRWRAEKLGKKLTGKCSQEECIFNEICLGGCRVEAYSFAILDHKDNPHYAGMDFCITHAIKKYLL